MKLILASSSPSRQRMLHAAGLAFDMVAPSVDEPALRADPGAPSDPVGLAAFLARAKALSVCGTSPPEAGVIGSDQTLALDDGSMIHKAADREELVDQIAVLAGRTHWLHSAACLVRGGDVLWEGVESVAMTMRPLDRAAIRAYVDAHWATIAGCVGGYRIEEDGVRLFDRIEGSHFAILGLPLLPLLAALRGAGWTL